MLTTTTKTKKLANDTLDKILQEVILLRQELKFVLPQDNLDDYENSDQIINSYQNALEKHSPLCK